MDIKVKLFDLSDGNKYNYVYASEVFDALTRYSKADELVYTYNDGRPHNLTDVVGKLKDVSWHDSCAWADIELLDTPNGKVLKSICEQNGNDAIKVEPIVSYRKVGDKILDFKLESLDVTTNIMEKAFDIGKIKEQLADEKANRMERLINRFNNMKPFTNVEDIPPVPITDADIYKDVIIPNLIRCGAIPKDKLEVGCTYEGHCRNAHTAVWKENGKFEYMRTKFGVTFPEKINHFQDDDGADVFVPIRKIVEEDENR